MCIHRLLRVAHIACSNDARYMSGNPGIGVAAGEWLVSQDLKLDELAAKKVYEFALIVQPLKIQGGTGSTVAPIAVR